MPVARLRKPNMHAPSSSMCIKLSQRSEGNLGVTRWGVCDGETSLIGEVWLTIPVCHPLLAHHLLWATPAAPP